MDGSRLRSVAVVLTIAFLHMTSASLLGELTLTTNPETGSVITAFEYQQHIELECVISEGATVINTVWSIQFASDLDNGGSGGGSLPTESEIISESDYRFSISGNGNSLLTINVFSPMLNGSTIFCHDEAYTLDANFFLRSTPIVVITHPEPGPIIVDEFSNVTILCDIQHENVDQQQWVVQGSILPDEGNSQFIISGDHQSQLTVVNFTEALDRTVIECHIAFHGNIPIAQFALLLPDSASGSGSLLTPDYDLNLTPEPGVITGFEGQENIEICCEIYDNTQSMRVTPTWTVLTLDDQLQGLEPSVIDPQNDDRFIFELGDPEELEIEVLTPELDGAIITCHETATEDMEAVGMWTLQSFPLVITTNPRPGPLVVSLHSQANITCSVEGVDSIYWILYRPDLPYTLLQNGDDERFIISGENMETLMIVDVTEDLHESVIFCQIPYHGDIDIGHFVLLLQERLQFPFPVPSVEEEPVSEECNPSDNLVLRQNITEYIREKLHYVALIIRDSR